MTQSESVVHSVPDILQGTPVFVGTRVPARVLFEYLEGGDSIQEFLDQYPSVSRQQVVNALEIAGKSLESGTRPAR